MYVYTYVLIIYVCIHRHVLCLCIYIYVCVCARWLVPANQDGRSATFETHLVPSGLVTIAKVSIDYDILTYSYIYICTFLIIQIHSSPKFWI